MDYLLRRLLVAVAPGLWRKTQGEAAEELAGKHRRVPNVRID